MIPTEHRRGQRVAAAMWVRLSNSGAELGMGSITNASISGAFLETALQLPVNASITLEPVSSAGAAMEGLKLAARVARIERHGVGIEWRVIATPEIVGLLTGTVLGEVCSATKTHDRKDLAIAGHFSVGQRKV